MRRYGVLRAFLLVAAAALLPGLALAAEERSLLTADGTLHVVRSGRAVDLGVSNQTVSPDSNVIEWTARAQDGTFTSALLPDSETSGAQRGLQLAFDDQTQTLLLLWTQDMSSYSQIRVGVLHDGAWTNSGLLPTQGISAAYNPQMVVTHQTSTYLDEKDAVVTTTNSILSIIWWEDAQYGQARYASLFLDEGSFDASNLSIYDFPVLLGGGGETPYSDIPSGAYLFPSLQADGLSGAIVASFADLHASKHRVVQIHFPTDQGKPSANDDKWKRRHIPIVGLRADGPLSPKAPWRNKGDDKSLAVGTSIGSGYRPTLYWLEGSSLRYTRLNGNEWETVHSISIDDSMTYDRALSLVVGMGTRN